MGEVKNSKTRQRYFQVSINVARSCCPHKTLLLPDKALESSGLRVNAERHSTSLLLLQNELMDDLW